MPDGQQPDCRESAAGVSRVVSQALVRLRSDHVSPRPPLEIYLSQMFAAACAVDGVALSEVVRKMRKARVSAAQIAEHYVPVVARRLGDAWIEDRIGFLQTSIGSVRLQGVLRELGDEWGVSTDAVVSDRAAYLVAVPQGFQHTLGATVLAGQLRHRGISVQLRYNLTPEILRMDMQRCVFRGVLLSAHDDQELASLRAFALEVAKFDRNTPVIIGGHSLERAEHIKTRTTADLATCDIGEAVAFCDQRHAEAQGRHIDDMVR